MGDRSRRTEDARAAGFELRPMALEDAERVAELHVAVWQATYDGLMRPEYLASLDPVRFAQRWQQELRGPDDVRLVGLDPKGGIVAFGVAGPVDSDAPARWQLHAINVLPQAQGSGLADLLISELVGERDAFLWVAQGNERSIAFYEAYGFLPDGATEHDKLRGHTELRMVRLRVTPAS